METETLRLHIPTALYERVRQVAEQTSRPVEAVVLDSIGLLFDELPAEESLTLETLNGYTTDQLWALAYRSFSWEHVIRLRELTALGQKNLLNEAEQQHMQHLLEQYDRFVLLRSRALWVLQQRGEPVEKLWQP